MGLYDQAARRVYLRHDLADGPAQQEFIVFIDDDTLVPVTRASSPGGDLAFIFYSRSSGIFHLYPNWGNPSVKIVIPIDPDGG